MARILNRYMICGYMKYKSPVIGDHSGFLAILFRHYGILASITFQLFGFPNFRSSVYPRMVNTEKRRAH
jgi:hypothetical protein